MKTLRLTMLALASAMALVACGSTSTNPVDGGSGGGTGGGSGGGGGSQVADSGTVVDAGTTCVQDAGTCNSCLPAGTDLGNQCAAGTGNCIHFDNSRVPAP